MTVPAWLRALPDARVVGGVPGEVSAVCYDSRRATPGCRFVAVPGATPSSLDGHRFIADALAAGASALVVQEDRRPTWEPALTSPGTPPTTRASGSARNQAGTVMATR